MSLAAVRSAVNIHGHQPAVDGLIAGLTSTAGVLVRPVAQRLERRRPAGARTAGLIMASLGMILAAEAFPSVNPALLFPIALVLGSFYGLLLFAGLRRVRPLGAPTE